MTLKDMLKEAKTSIRIIGTNPLIPHLEQSARLLTDMLLLNDGLHILVLCESDTENFNQSLCTNDPSSQPRLSFASLSVHRDRVMGTGKKDGLVEEIRQLVATEAKGGSILRRIYVRQVNLRLPVNVVEVDGTLLCAIITNTPATIDSYFQVKEGPLRDDILRFVDFYTNPKKGGVYLSGPQEELIQLYDKNGIPRGIFPRACFYTTEFSRYSVWGFVFNRNGELLLHQRSRTAKDGRDLWDKSIGGHVDLLDSSTSITAERELVEEMFLPQAEYTKYLRADLGDIMNFGDWNPGKRPERTFREAFAGLAASDWVMFRATDARGEPLTVTRISDRRIQEDDAVVIRRTVFRSDVYLFIAPRSYLDTHEEMTALLGHAEASGAAQAHRLVSIDGLRLWISREEADGRDREVFTDDLLFVNLQYREMLEGFAEFVSFISQARPQ
jgi:hypothetical protein